MSTGKARLAAELAGTTAPTNPVRCWFEPGVVKAVVTGYSTDPTMTVTWRDLDVPCSYLAPYSPAEGDVVLLAVQPPSLIALGRLIGPDTDSTEGT